MITKVDNEYHCSFRYACGHWLKKIVPNQRGVLTALKEEQTVARHASCPSCKVNQLKLVLAHAKKKGHHHEND